MRYRINIEETLNKIVEIEADNEEQAENIVREMYDNGEIVLGSEDFLEVEFDFP